MKRQLVFSLGTILAMLSVLFAARPSRISAESSTLLPVSGANENSK